MNATRHGDRRARQRSIPPLIIDWLLDFGAITYDKRGAQVRYFDKCARRTLEQCVGRQVVRRLADYLDCYGVFDDGLLITTGWLCKRIPRF